MNMDKCLNFSARTLRQRNRGSNKDEEFIYEATKPSQFQSVRTNRPFSDQLTGIFIFTAESQGIQI